MKVKQFLFLWQIFISCFAIAEEPVKNLASPENYANIRTISIPQFKTPISLSFTIDDLPASGAEASFISREEVSLKIIQTLVKQKVPAVYGFMNGILLTENDRQNQILSAWKKSGHLLGNHTYSHLDLAKVSAEEFIEDIKKNETNLIDHADNIQELKVFRYPYLMEGNSLEKRYQVRSYLLKRHYKIAQVTVDSEDWIFNNAFIRCKNKGMEEESKKIIENYVNHILHVLIYNEKLAHFIYGEFRSIPHIMLSHYNVLNAYALELIVSTLKKQNVNLISAVTAINNSIFNEDFPLEMRSGIPFFEQMLRSRKLKFKNISSPYLKKSWLESVCD